MTIRSVSYYEGLEVHLAQLHKAAFPPTEYWHSEAFRDLLRLPTHHLCVSYNEVHGLQGFLLYSLVIDEVEIITFAVEPIWQGKGIGEQLMQYFLQEMKAQSVYSVFLEVAENNKKAYALYAKHKFEVVVKRLNYYNNGQNAFLMRRFLM